MICRGCEFDSEQVVYCDCGAALCHQCFGMHKCSGAERARFTGQPDQPEREFARHDVSELADAHFRLRPYQQAAIDAVIGALE